MNPLNENAGVLGNAMTPSRKRRLSNPQPLLAPAPITNPTTFAMASETGGPTTEPLVAASPPKKGRTNTPWTPAEELRLKRMRDEGKSWSEIAKVRAASNLPIAIPLLSHQVFSDANRGQRQEALVQG